MNNLQLEGVRLELTRLIGKKELTFGCWLFIQNPDGYAQYIEESDVGDGFTIMSATDGYSILQSKEDRFKEYEIIGHPATLSDFHRWMNDKKDKYCDWKQYTDMIVWYGKLDKMAQRSIPYDSSKELLEQSDETLKQIISLIKSTEGKS